MRKLFDFCFSCFLFFALFSLTAWCITTQVTISWDALTSPNVAGYQVVWGPKLIGNNNTLQVGKIDQVTLDVKSGRTYTFAVRAIDAQGSVGELSSEVSVYISVNRRRVGQHALADPNSIFLPSVKENAQFRTNLGVNNTASTSASVAATLVDRAGIVQALKSIEVPAGGMIQVNRIVSEFGSGSGLAMSEGNIILESDQSVLAWASEIDNQSNDPSMLTGRKTGSSRLLIPSVANTGAWTSSMVLGNLGIADAPITITAYSPEGMVLAKKQGSLVVPSLGNLSFNNILASLGVENSYGPMEILSTGGQPLVATSRVYGSTGAGGFFEAVPSEMAASSQIVPHLFADANRRTNLGINNFSGKIANVILRFIGKTGTVLAKMTTQVVPNGLNQINSADLVRIITGSSGSNVECYVRLDSDQPVLAWASQIENSNNDPGFALGKKAGGRRLLIPSSANATIWNSSLVIVNTSAQSAYVDIVARDNNGGTLGQMQAVWVPAGGFFSRSNILSFLGVTNNYGPIEVSSSDANANLLATSRIQSTDRTSGFFEGQILE